MGDKSITLETRNTLILFCFEAIFLGLRFFKDSEILQTLDLQLKIPLKEKFLSQTFSWGIGNLSYVSVVSIKFISF